MKNNWQEIKLKTIFEFKNGLNKEKKYFGHGSPIVNYVDVYNGGGLTTLNVKGRVDVNKSELKRFDVKKGDVFFTRTSETIDEIGYSAVAIDDFKDTVFSGFVLRARQKGSFILTGFAKYCFSTQRTRKEIMAKSSCTTRALTSGSHLNHVSIPLPSIEEQERIVRVLECWDGYLEKLERKIEVKKNIKKALMQKLLTGEKRLDGFSDKWQVVKLGDVSEITTGSSNREDSSLEGEYTFFDRSEDVRSSNIYLFDGEAVIVAGEGQKFVPKYFVGKFDLHQRTYAIMNFKNADGKFIYYYLNQYKNYLLSQAVGSTVKSLRLPMFVKMSIKLPKLEEQKAIAEILTKADDEITSLEKKKEIIEAQKKYLLNNLVTGKVLTPENL